MSGATIVAPPQGGSVAPPQSGSASSSVDGRQSVSDRDAPLADYFFRSTVAALANDLPPPKLEFYFSGVRFFVLMAEEDEFLLLDFDDVVQSADQQSKRNFKEMIEDEESIGLDQFVFASVYSGTYESVRSAIEFVCRLFSAQAAADETSGGGAASTPFLSAVVSRAVVKPDSIVYETDRRYSDVEHGRCDTMHQLKRQSDRAAALELLGDVALTWLRVFNHRFWSRPSK